MHYVDDAAIVVAMGVALLLHLHALESSEALASGKRQNAGIAEW